MATTARFRQSTRTPQRSETAILGRIGERIRLPRAPWREEISAEVAAELDLGRFQALGTSQAGYADIAVLGGGVAGLSAAMAAARAGAGVVVLEGARRLGLGATGQNAGILSAGINMGLADVPTGSPDAEMWPATTRALLGLVEQTQSLGSLLAASRTGSLSLAESASAARHLAREARARVAAGLHAEMWSPTQVAEATGGHLRTAGLQAALWLPDEGRINPLTLLAHLARETRRAGAVLCGDAYVTACEVERGAAGTHWRLRLQSGGKVRARALVRAVGPTVEPTARIAALAFEIELPESFPLFWDSRPFTYCDFRPGRTRLVASGGRYSRPGAVGRDALYYRRLAEAARHWLPELAEAQPTHAWAVDLAVASDLSPRLCELDARVPGLAIEGLGALGVLPGMVLGRRAGETLAERISR
jgi:glycine/D-amino acid oxidase-like deaminating enzyme